MPSPRPPSPPPLLPSQRQPGLERRLGRSERLWWGGTVCPSRSPPPRRLGQTRVEGGSCSPRRPWGAAEGTATGAGAPPGVEVERRASSMFPGWKPPPPPNQIPGRGRAGAGSGGGSGRRQCNFTRPWGSGSSEGSMSYGVSRGFRGNWGDLSVR